MIAFKMTEEDKKKKMEEEEKEEEIQSMMEWVFKTLETINEFRKDELNMFADFALHMISNPRKIKRITMIYRVVRVLAKKEGQDGDDKVLEINRKLLSWILLLEQWPVRMSWILQILEDDEQDEYVLKERGGCFLLNSTRVMSRHVSTILLYPIVPQLCVVTTAKFS